MAVKSKRSASIIKKKSKSPKRAKSLISKKSKSPKKLKMSKASQSRRIKKSKSRKISKSKSRRVRIATSPIFISPKTACQKKITLVIIPKNNKTKNESE